MEQLVGSLKIYFGVACMSKFASDLYYQSSQVFLLSTNGLHFLLTSLWSVCGKWYYFGLAGIRIS